MKKFLALILALTMVMSLGAVAFADTTIADKTGHEDEETFPEDTVEDIPVKVTFANEVKTYHRYSIDVTWTSMEFKYTLSGSRYWDPADHQYETEDGQGASTGTAFDESANLTGTWDNNNQKITLVNNSDLDVKYSVKYTDSGSDEVVPESFVKFNASSSKVDGTTGISDEVLADYISGNSSEGNKAEIEVTLEGDPTSWKDLDAEAVSSAITIGNIKVTLEANV